MKKIPLFILLLTSFFSLSSFPENNGFDFIVKRYVYQESNNGGISVSLKNNTASEYLVEAWVASSNKETLLPIENEVGKDTPFIILPPLKKMNVNSDFSWNIRRSGSFDQGEKLPTDRESIFWIVLRAIPGEEKSQIQNDVRLDIVPVFFFKILYRPKNIEDLTLHKVANQVILKKENGFIYLDNPTPLYIHFDNIKIGNTKIKNGDREYILKPFSKQKIAIPKNTKGQLKWQLSDENSFELKEQTSQ